MNRHSEAKRLDWYRSYLQLGDTDRSREAQLAPDPAPVRCHVARGRKRLKVLLASRRRPCGERR